jgi:hypothetical protein
MTRTLATLTLGTLLSATAVHAAPDRDHHLRIQVGESGGSKVDLTLPLAAVELVAALIPDATVKANISIDGRDIEAHELRRLWRELRHRPDMTYLTVTETDGGRVRIAKSKGELLMFVDDGADKVEIRIPNRAVDALFASFDDNGERLDVGAMLHTLASSRGGEIVAISGRDRVRIWIGEDEE